MTRGQEVSAWALLLLLGLLLGGGLVEAGVRVLHLVPDRFWEPDAKLGWRHSAGRTGWWTQEDREFLVPISISRQGLRDVEHAYAKPAGVTRVLLLGDSFIEALQVPLAATVARRLEAHLGATTEVINAGVSGYGTASELLFLRDQGLRYAPDVVLLAFYPGNDVKNNSATLEDILPPVYDGGGKLERVTAPLEGFARARTGWRDHVQAYRYTRQLLLRHPELTAPLRRLGVAASLDAPRAARERDGVPVDYWVYAPEPSAEWEDAWRRTESLLAAVRATAISAGSRFAIAVIPSRYQIYPELWAETLAAHPAMQGRAWELAGPTRRLLRWCETQGVPCLDLAAGLVAAVKTSAPLYFHHDGHWTAAGHETVAQQLKNFLRERQLVSVQEAETHELH